VPGPGAIIDLICKASPVQESAKKRTEALLIMSACVGAVTLARAVSDPKLSEQILEGALSEILDMLSPRRSMRNSLSQFRAQTSAQKAEKAPRIQTPEESLLQCHPGGEPDLKGSSPSNAFRAASSSDMAAAALANIKAGAAASFMLLHRTHSFKSLIRGTVVVEERFQECVELDGQFLRSALSECPKPIESFGPIRVLRPMVCHSDLSKTAICCCGQAVR